MFYYTAVRLNKPGIKTVDELAKQDVQELTNSVLIKSRSSTRPERKSKDFWRKRYTQLPYGTGHIHFTHKSFILVISKF